MDEYNIKDLEKQKIYLESPEEAEGKPKKFVFQIYPENIDYIASMSYDKKNVLINQLITNYREDTHTEEHATPRIFNYTKIITRIFILIIMIPLFLFFLNIALNATKTNYNIYQENFEKLFKSHY